MLESDQGLRLDNLPGLLQLHAQQPALLYLAWLQHEIGGNRAVIKP